MESRNYGFTAPRVEETTLGTADVQIERKVFHFTLKENPRGQFVRITESGAMKNSIILPATGLEAMGHVLKEMQRLSTVSR